MVDVYRTEEEQIEAIKRWWKKDGLRTIALVVLLFAGYFAWQGWQQQTQNTAAAASDVFEQLIKADTALLGGGATEQALALVAELKADYSGSYAQYAGLYAAKYAVQRNDLAAAQAELNWVLDQNPSDEIAELTRLRLARVLFAQNEYDAALSEIDVDDTEAWNMKKYDLQGDIYLAQNNVEQARIAYEKAMAYSTGSLTSRFIELKLNSIPAGVGSADE